MVSFFHLFLMIVTFIVFLIMIYVFASAKIQFINNHSPIPYFLPIEK